VSYPLTARLRCVSVARKGAHPTFSQAALSRLHAPSGYGGGVGGRGGGMNSAKNCEKLVCNM
jgi:hypothetical protein